MFDCVYHPQRSSTKQLLTRVRGHHTLSPSRRAELLVACVAKDSEFGAWIRAIVTDICEGDMINILFLDYG